MVEIYFGQEKYLADRVRRRLIASGGYVFNGLTEDFFSAASSLSFFDEGGRVFVIESAEPEKDFLALTSRIPQTDDTVAIFRDTLSASAIKALSGFRLHECRKLSDANAVTFVMETAKEAGAVFDRNAAARLLALCDYQADGNLYDVARETERLAFASDRVTAADVDTFGNESRGAQVFRFVDACLAKRAEEALAETDRLLSDKDFSALKTLGLIERSIRLSYKELLLEGLPQGAVKEALGIPRLVPVLPKEQLINIFHALSEARNAIKTGRMKDDVALKYVVGAILSRESLSS